MACSESDNSKYSTIDGKPTNYEAILAISKDQGILKDKPKLISFVTLESRTKTLLNLPLEIFDETARTQLAEAGFIFEKSTGHLVCFYCAVVIKTNAVLKEHNPWYLHVQKFAKCAHVRHCKEDTSNF